MCENCNTPNCLGPGELRHFTDWTDLAAHLDESDIVRLVNHLHTIGEEYVRLKEAEEQRQLRATAQRNYNAALLAIAKSHLSADELATLRAQGAEAALRKQEAAEHVSGVEGHGAGVGRSVAGSRRVRGMRPVSISVVSRGA